jgi:SAM-dependent MidA family methyltransferase
LLEHEIKEGINFRHIVPKNSETVVAEAMPYCKLMSDLRNEINEVIRQAGSISFAHFMELCLYSPGNGYYEQVPEIGKAGDFYTSVSVGSHFGKLLAFEFSSLLAADQHHLVEVGAHNGQLMADVLSALEVSAPAVFCSLQVIIVEPSRSRQTIQQATLSRFRAKIRWVESLAELGVFAGILFSNELLDAFPVHRLRWNRPAQQWQEYFVGLSDGEYTWELGPLSFAEENVLVPAELLPYLPDGFQWEVNLSALNWWSQAGRCLTHGHLLAFDYGFTHEDYFRSGKTAGTLRAYRNHRASDDLLASPGEQDLTAHVDFDAIRRAGENVGLNTIELSSQAAFLTRIFQKQVSRGETLDSASIRAFQTLTSPEHLGRFRVLIQSRP